MGFKTASIYDVVSDFWKELPVKDREVIASVWESYHEHVTDLWARLIYTDRAKSVRDIHGLQHREFIGLVFDDNNRVPEKITYQAESKTGKTDPVLTQRFLDDNAKFITNGVADADEAFIVFDTPVLVDGGTPVTSLKITVVFSETEVEVELPFDTQGLTDITYQVDSGTLTHELSATPWTFAYTLPEASIRVIEELRDSWAVSGTTLTYDNGDYKLASGRIYFREEPPRFLYAPVVLQDNPQLFDNFGDLVFHQFQPSNLLFNPLEATPERWRGATDSYRRELEGLLLARWTGPTITNVQLGSTIFLELPFGGPGTVDAIIPPVGAEPPGWDGTRRVIIDGEAHVIPDYLGTRVIVEVGDVLSQVEALTDAVKVDDFVLNTAYAQDYTKPPLQSFHSFVVIVEDLTVNKVQAAKGRVFDLSELFGFLEDVKPEHTDFQFITTVVTEDIDELASVIVTTRNGPQVMACGTLDANYTNMVVWDDYRTVNGLPADKDDAYQELRDRADAATLKEAYRLDSCAVGLAEGALITNGATTHDQRISP